MDEIKICHPRADWHRVYLAEATELESAVAAHAVEIDHVGSTAVPRLAAKPVVDIVVGVQAIQDIEQVCIAFGRLGLQNSTLSEAYCDARFLAGRANDGVTDVHVHVALAESQYRARMIVFRDRLLQDRHLSSCYERLKRDLALRFPYDIDAYTEGKSDFVLKVLGV